jgi:hypothetical protein
MHLLSMRHLRPQLETQLRLAKKRLVGPRRDRGDSEMFRKLIRPHLGYGASQRRGRNSKLESLTLPAKILGYAFGGRIFLPLSLVACLVVVFFGADHNVGVWNAGHRDAVGAYAENASTLIR